MNSKPLPVIVVFFVHLDLVVVAAGGNCVVMGMPNNLDVNQRISNIY